MILFAEGHELASHKEILDALGSMGIWPERGLEIMSILEALYFKDYRQLEQGYLTADEVERLEEDYSKDVEVARDCLSLLRSNKSSGLLQ